MNIKRIGGKVHDLVFDQNGYGYTGCSRWDTVVTVKTSRNVDKIVDKNYRESKKQVNCKRCFSSRVR